MIKNGFRGVLIFVAAFLFHKTAFAEVIELPPEELAQESVYPVFDKPVSVRSRNVVTAGRFDIVGFYGMALTEPIADVSKFGLALYYNFNEDHALGLLFAKNSTGLSSYANQLSAAPYNLDFNRAPKPESVMMLDYNLKMFYGKMSITKSTVFNTSLFGTAAGGMVKYQHKGYPAIALGIGQKFYMTNNLALRMDLRLYAHQAPIPFLSGTTGVNTAKPVPAYGDFQERMTYTTNLEAGLSYLF